MNQVTQHTSTWKRKTYSQTISRTLEETGKEEERKNMSKPTQTLSIRTIGNQTQQTMRMRMTYSQQNTTIKYTHTTPHQHTMSMRMRSTQTTLPRPHQHPTAHHSCTHHDTLLFFVIFCSYHQYTIFVFLGFCDIPLFVFVFM